MTFKIDTDVAMLPRDNAGGKYGPPMRALTKVGYSFFIPKAKLSSITGPLGRWKLKLGIEIACRTEGNGVRVWRTQ